MREAVRTMFAVNLAESLQYRGSAVLWSVSGFLAQLMALAVWSAVAEAKGGSVGAYSQGDLVFYFASAQIVGALAGTWVIWKMHLGVRTGSLSAELLRPIPPFAAWFTEIYAFKAVMLIFQVPALIIGSIALGATIPDVSATTLLAPLAIFTAIALRYACDLCVGSSAFWMVNNDGVGATYFLSFLLLSGSFAPVEVMPPAFRVVAVASPFYSMLGFPVDLLNGRLSPSQALGGFAVQLAWLAFGVLAARILWKRGLRQYSAVGA